MCGTKIILAMIFNEIKCHVRTSLGLLGMHPCIPPVSAPGRQGCKPPLWQAICKKQTPT